MQESKVAKIRFSEVVEKFRGDPNVSIPQNDEKEKPRRFGSFELKVKGKIFAMLTSGGSFVVKLRRSRVDQLVARGHGTRFDPRRNGQLMKEWIVMKERSKINWVDVAMEASEYSKACYCRNPANKRGSN